jgi:diguanylate cyclase (GGDEF)-like protein
MAMPEVLELCIQLDSLAHSTYRAMSKSCPDQSVARVFAQMAKDESAHVDWWKDLREAWDKGLIPDIISDTESLVLNLRSIAEELDRTRRESWDGATTTQMLEAAAHMEFYMLDPSFADLIELTDPGAARSHRESYSRHIDRLVTAIEHAHEESDLARFLARVLRRAWSDNVTLSLYAMRDPLTALYNRRGMNIHLRHWLAWADRYGRPVAVLLVDVDDFKAINDTYGHASGDRALKEVARCLKRSVRSSDIVVRYGGDEFAIIAPETEGDELRHLMDRIVEASCEASALAEDGAALPLRVSVGAAVVTGNGGQTAEAAPSASEKAPRSTKHSGGISVDRLLAAADHSLYAAKAGGKNRAGEPIAYRGIRL